MQRLYLGWFVSTATLNFVIVTVLFDRSVKDGSYLSEKSLF